MTRIHRSSKPTVAFQPNVPVTLALKSARYISNQHGERIMMFSTVDGRVMFVDIEVAEQIEALKINVRKPFSITKTWVVSQPNGTPVNVLEHS